MYAQSQCDGYPSNFNYHRPNYSSSGYTLFQPAKQIPICFQRVFASIPILRPSIPSDSPTPDWGFILIGQILNNRRISEALVHDFIINNWPIANIPEVICREDGLWLFIFQHEKDLLEVLQNGPYDIGNLQLVIHRANPATDSMEIDFSRVPTWIEFRGIPIKHVTRELVTQLASYVGEVIELEFNDARPYTVAFPRVRIFLDLLRPVVPAIGINDGYKVHQILVRYRMGMPCRRCGCFGHKTAHCRSVQEVIMSPLSEMIYRPKNIVGFQIHRDDQHTLYTQGNKGTGVLMNWIPWHESPLLNTPNGGYHRAQYHLDAVAPPNPPTSTRLTSPPGFPTVPPTNFHTQRSISPSDQEVGHMLSPLDNSTGHKQSFACITEPPSLGQHLQATKVSIPQKFHLRTRRRPPKIHREQVASSPSTKIRTRRASAVPTSYQSSASHSQGTSGVDRHSHSSEYTDKCHALIAGPLSSMGRFIRSGTLLLE